MSRVWNIVSGVLIAVGIVGIVAGGVVVMAPPAAEIRVLVVPTVRLTAEQFAGVIDASLRVTATLAEFARFQSFRDAIGEGGFAVPPAALTEERQLFGLLGGETIRVTHVDDTLVLRVRARGQTPQEARAIAGAAAHTLALSARTVLGNGVVNVLLDRAARTLPVLGDMRAANTLSLFGTVLALAGGVVRARARKERFVSDVSEEPPDEVPPEPPPPVEGKPTPEEARYWLQKFLEFNSRQQGTRPSADQITTWDDVPVPSRNGAWLKAPDALLV